MGPRSALLSLMVLAGLTCSVAARADDEEEPIIIAYRAPAECPTQQAFLDQLRRRGIRAPIAAPGARARTFDIDVTIDARAHGRLTVLGTDGERVTRLVEGKSCDELVSGLAVMTAVAISPNATLEPPSDAPPPPPAPSPLPEPPRPPPRPRPPLVASSRAPEARASRLGVSLGLRAFSAFAVAPDPIVGAGVFVGLAYGRASMRVGVEQTLPDTIGAGFARARFAWTTAPIELCPTSAQLAWVELAPCGVLTMGAIWATDSGGLQPRDDVRFWASAGARGRARAAFARRWWIELSVAGAATLTRDRFILRPNTPVYEPGPASVELGLAMGVRFE